MVKYIYNPNIVLTAVYNKEDIFRFPRSRQIFTIKLQIEDKQTSICRHPFVSRSESILPLKMQHASAPSCFQKAHTNTNGQGFCFKSLSVTISGHAESMMRHLPSRECMRHDCGSSRGLLCDSHGGCRYLILSFF